MITRDAMGSEPRCFGCRKLQSAFVLSYRLSLKGTADWQDDFGSDKIALMTFIPFGILARPKNTAIDGVSLFVYLPTLGQRIIFKELDDRTDLQNPLPQASI